MTHQTQIQTQNIPAQASSKARFNSQKQTGYVCKSCGGVAPVGVGYAVSGWQGVADESRTACDCGYSVKPVAEPVSAQAESLFSADDLIHSYSRAQAIADGVLVDVTTTAAEAGFKIPVAITRAAWADCVEWNDEIEARKATTQDESGRLWDVVWLAFVACRASGEGQRRVFELHRVPREGRGNRPRRVSLAVCIGPGDDHYPVITIMQPTED